jgi:serine phosphatase RsbU (regulator of sigma subunit)
MRKIIFSLTSFILVCWFCIFSAYSQKLTSVDALIESTQNDSVRIQVLIQLSQEYLNSDPIKGFDFAINALVLATNLNNKRGIGLASNNLGDFYWYKYDFVSSEEYYKEGLKIFKELNDSVGISDGYRNIGWIYFNKNENVEALEYHKKSLEINQKFNFKKRMSANYSDLGLTYMQLKKYDSAISYHCLAVDIEKEFGSIQNLVAIYQNMGNVYRELGVYWLAIDMSLKALKYAEESGSKRRLYEAYQGLSVLNKDIKDYDGAVHFANLAIQVAREIDDKNAVYGVYTLLAEVYDLKHNYTQALHYVQLSSALSDSIFDEENNRLYEEMLKKYESENKVFAIQNLKKDKEIAEYKLAQEKKTRIYLIVFVVLVAGFAIFLMRNNKQRERINLSLVKASEQIKEKNEEIMDSIVYSKRIQDVCLPSEALRHKLFNSSFIFFKPKDIVSGDFYWYTEKDGKRIIACCDCTGHGVPGALLSMIGINSLNRIVNGKGITSTDEILQAFHYEISKTLKQDDQIYVNDVIDVAIVCFNSENEIEYSGANSPLWIVKKGSQLVSELVEIEPDRLSVGVVNANETIKYTKHSIALQKEDCIYLFSDGLFYQSNSINSDKYSVEQLKLLLLEVATSPINQQESIIQTSLTSWMGGVEQIDDISIIGIKI